MSRGRMTSSRLLSPAFVVSYDWLAPAHVSCNGCPVIDACLRFALENGMTAGVWGGLTEDERRARKRRTVRPAL